MKTYVTFGQNHVHRVNGITFDCDCVAVIEAPSAVEGRQRAQDAFGLSFCTSYSEDCWNEDSLKYYPRGYLPVL